MVVKTLQMGLQIYVEVYGLPRRSLYGSIPTNDT